MKKHKRIGRLLSGILISAMLMANMTQGVSASEIISNTGSDISTNESESNEADTSDTDSVDPQIADQTGSDAADSENSEDMSDSEDSEDMGTSDEDVEDDPVSDNETEDISESETETEASEDLLNSPGSRLQITDTIDLDLKYDDYYELSDIDDDYVLVCAEDTEVTSYQVSGGAVTKDKDTDIVTAQDDGAGHELRATGVGTTTLYYAASTDAEQVKEIIEGQNTESNSFMSMPAGRRQCVQVNVTVEAADLTLMMLLGQSNMQGSCSGAVYNPENSVLCEKGQVYSSYFPKFVSQGNLVAAADYAEASTLENVDRFVAESLTSTKSLNGNSLEYKLSSLTSLGDGKTGMDAGLAYEWNRLTGEKVWTVNAAWGASSITSWVQGGACYEKTIAVYKRIKKVINAECSAGHYVLKNTLAFWLQGETDRYMSAQVYSDNFISMYNSFNANMGLDYLGIIAVRSHLGNNCDAQEFYFDGPRSVQYVLAASEYYPKICMASNANEKWVTNSGVKNYFNSKYPGGVPDYPMRSTSTITANPTSIGAVHADSHYSQVAHNENGIDAADGMYSVVYGSQSINDAYWVDYYDNETSEVTVERYGSAALVLKTEPISSLSDIHYSYDLTNISYNSHTGIVSSKSGKTGTYTITARDSSGNVLGTVDIVVIDKPPVVTAVNGTKGVTVSWNAKTNAKAYYVYRKVPGGSWSKIGSAAGTATSYTDTSVVSKNGQVYMYTVRASYNAGLSGFVTDVYIERLANPNYTLANTSSGIGISWSAISGAKKYIIYRRTKTGSFAQIATVTQKSGVSKLSYTDTSVAGKNQTLYYYTVRAIGTYNGVEQKSSFYTDRSITRISMPKVTSLTNVTGGIQVKWSTVTGATGYYLYRRVYGGSWSRIATLKGTVTSYTDKDGLKSGTKYQYTVKAYIGSSVSTFTPSSTIVKK